MTNPFSELDLQQAIDLRWTLREIKAKRWVLSPINPSHLEKLIALGLVELRNDSPILTIFLRAACPRSGRASRNRLRAWCSGPIAPAEKISLSR
jgi:hypothetical protein